jgi:hypothetical protein
MHDYPEALAPRGIDSFDKEPFSAWWARVRAEFPGVPRNVARQWIWRHWGHSDYAWIPSRRAEFRLEIWPAADIAHIQVPHTRPGEYEDWGAYLVSLYKPKNKWRYSLAGVMQRRQVWPAPPIVLDNRPMDDIARTTELPSGPVLVEGNRRLALARYLFREECLMSHLPVWIIRLHEAQDSAK